MTDDLSWARTDLERATKLYTECQSSGQPVDEQWENNGFDWHLIARQGQVVVRGQAVPGLWDAYLTAYGTVRGIRSSWRFAWSGNEWYAAKHTEFI